MPFLLTLLLLLLLFTLGNALQEKPSMFTKPQTRRRPLVWENKEHKHESWDSSFSLCNLTSPSKIHVLNAVASPGSFAGRTGHSGATKFTLESDLEYTSGKMVRQSWFSRSRRSRDSDNNDDNEEEEVEMQSHQGIKESVALCEWTEDCPIGGHGRQTVSGRRAKVPWYTPSGKYRYRYELKDGKGVETLFCVDVMVRVECPEKAYVCPGLPLV